MKVYNYIMVVDNNPEGRFLIQQFRKSLQPYLKLRIRGSIADKKRIFRVFGRQAGEEYIRNSYHRSHAIKFSKKLRVYLQSADAENMWRSRVVGAADMDHLQQSCTNLRRQICEQREVIAGAYETIACLQAELTGLKSQMAQQVNSII